jgi:hypothetical protein
MLSTSHEGGLTRFIERGTQHIPSAAFLGVAAASVLGAVVSYATGRKQLANFVGEWVPTFLLLGIYNKIVKET